MKTILCIGHRHYLLSPSANVNVLLKALGEAVPVDQNYHAGEYFYAPEKDRRRNEISVVMIRNDQYLDGKRKLLPEKCGPESLGKL